MATPTFATPMASTVRMLSASTPSKCSIAFSTMISPNLECLASRVSLRVTSRRAARFSTSAFMRAARWSHQRASLQFSSVSFDGTHGRS